MEFFWDYSGNEIVGELISGFMSQLENALDSVSSDIQDHVTAITRAISQATKHFQQFRDQNQLDENFVK